MQILNIAGYKFISLSNLADLKQALEAMGTPLAIGGTILLSEEGININLAGEVHAIDAFLTDLKNNSLFSDMKFHRSLSAAIPFKHFKVKIKKEIITFNQASADPTQKLAPTISPEQFKQWMDEKKAFTILDTRNDYEVEFGTFENAKNLQIKDFGEFSEKAKQVEKDKPVVMFCTGGIRCEKAALYMLSEGYEEVYQLDGGILGYFAKVGGEHYEGECFVFDERIAVNPDLQPSGTSQCKRCHHPIPASAQMACAYC